MALTIVLRAKGPPAEGEPALSLTFDSPRIVIGRGEGCDVRLPDPSVSHRHASIRQRGAEYIVLDEGSTNGTRLGKVLLAPQSPRVIRSGDLLRIGRVWLEVRASAALVPPGAAALAEAVALELVRRALTAQGEDARTRVLVDEGPDAGKELVLADPARRYVLGRGRDADLVLDEPRASRRHVELGLRGKDVVARDLGSQEPASLDGLLLAPSDTPWRAGKTLAICTDRLSLVHPAAEALAELERGPDEPMRAGESVDEPEEEPSPEPSSAAPPESGTPAPPPAGDVLVAPRPARRELDTEVEEGGWSLADAAVLMAAMGVLALSIAGLVWLLR